MKMKIGIYIGRLQPFHKGHEAIIRAALAKFDKVIVLLGSAQEVGTTKNPFTVIERETMIYDCFEREYDSKALVIDDLFDYPGKDERWVQQVIKTVAAYSLPEDEHYLVGFDKDASSYYLKLLPWPLYVPENFEPVRDEQGNILGSTHVRKLLLDGDTSFEQLVPEPVAKILKSYMRSKDYKLLLGTRVLEEREAQRARTDLPA